MKPQFLIAAPSSNSGKTTITLGLLRLLSDQGYAVQSFKCGPDYIDTQYHQLASKKPGINLDSFMMSKEHIKSCYLKYSADAGVTVVEGVMGLFDGADKMQGSSAEIAIILGLPVILVVDARAMAYSAAALIFGFKNFDPRLKIAGVIFNFVNTESHFRFLKDACGDAGVEALGYVPVNDIAQIPSRHLGLVAPDEMTESTIEQMSAHISKTVHVNRLLKVCATMLPPEDKRNIKPKPKQKKLRIAVAKDAAFNFMYHENIEVFRSMGEVIYFSPIHDKTLPGAGLVYFPGGYPELFLLELTANKEMLKGVYAFCKDGGKVIAECGGMMYLGKSIVDKDGSFFPMVGFLDIETSMKHAKLSLGYRTIHVKENIWKGHEFHYSSSCEKSSIPAVGEVLNAKGIKVNTPVYRQGNVLASYIHFYWGEHPQQVLALTNEI